MNIDSKKIALFLGGTLFGSAGFKLLGSRDAKKLYTNTVAAYLRCKDQVMHQFETVQENYDDILTDAKQINEARSTEEADEFIEDAAGESAVPQE